MDFNYGEITDKMTNCCDEISDPTPILVASRIAQDHDPIKAGSFVESDRIEKSWADEKLVIRSLFHSDRIFSGIGPWFSAQKSGSRLRCRTMLKKIHWNTQKTPTKHVLRLFEKFLKIRFSAQKCGSQHRFRTMLKYLETLRKHQLNMFWGF